LAALILPLSSRVASAPLPYGRGWEHHPD
jgi:hypothetical protein